MPDLRSIAEIKTLPPDIVIIPGGGPGAATLSSDPAVLALLQRCANERKWIAAICAGTTALVAAFKETPSVKDNVTVTSHPSVKDDIVKAGWKYSEERVVVSKFGNIITSRGPGTALGWSLAIVEALSGKDKRNEIEGPMLIAEKL
jgi:protein DJ-1